LQQPPETDAYGTTDPTQRDSLQEEAFNQCPLFFGDHNIVRRKNKGPAAHFAAVILFTRVNMPVSLEPP